MIFQLEVAVEDKQRELDKTRDDTTRYHDNYNAATPRKQFSDPSETLARMKARLNQSINKYLDEKINNDGSSDIYSSQGSGGAVGSGDGTPPEDIGAAGLSPRYVNIMRSNYYL